MNDETTYIVSSIWSSKHFSSQYTTPIAKIHNPLETNCNGNYAFALKSDVHRLANLDNKFWRLQTFWKSVLIKQSVHLNNAL